MHVCVSFVINIFGGLNFHHFIGENGEHGPDAYVSFRTPPLRGGVPGLGLAMPCTWLEFTHFIVISPLLNEMV